MAMAVAFYVRAYIGIDMFIGTVIMFVWGKLYKVKAVHMVLQSHRKSMYIGPCGRSRTDWAYATLRQK
ncbi:hypothetical protein Syun_011659 [Stephania yunnanensis]|uniref:Uncharacterized protein n=1 Tax=Stephania yunnanensis TaxID=152371 RepID=A0AAP0JYP1_9MAGN